MALPVRQRHRRAQGRGLSRPIGAASACASPMSLRLARATCRISADLAWASFPCQDLSLAGAGAGLDGARSGAFWAFCSAMRAWSRRARAASDCARERGRRAHLQGRRGFRRDLRGAPRPRLSLRRADHRRCAYSAAVAAPRVLCRGPSRRRPARLAGLARPAAASRLGRARSAPSPLFPRRSLPIGCGGARPRRRARTSS